MSTATKHQGHLARSSVLFLSGVIGVSFVGYLIGIRPANFDPEPAVAAFGETDISVGYSEQDGSTIPAASYLEVRRTETGPTSLWKPTLDQIPQPEIDLFAEIKPTEEEKQQSTLVRASRRAFNGAPPVIPHAVERTDDAACYACHGKGMRIENKIANQMSHGFPANCTQCHAPPAPEPFRDLDASVQNAFVGMPAPSKGERAFPGAPPTIPHSTWMRQTCLSCHGNGVGWSGLQSTHPWRVSCQQCHAPSARLNQGIVSDEIEFLPAIERSTE